MSRQNIKKFSIGYAIVQAIGMIYHRFYYRKFKIVNREKVPRETPVIYAINHQNALMDALTIVFTNPRQVVFMARADIFRKKMIASILYFLKILPAYRIRDGFHSVDQNKEVFKEVILAIENSRPVAILPEGNHFGEKRLRPLKKGAARLAMLAGESNGFKNDIAIVPVGIDYSNYYHAGSDMLIQFGDPLHSLNYYEQYIQNPTTAINSITSDLDTAMRKVMIDIGPEEHYQAIHDAVEMYSQEELKRQNLRPGLLNGFKVKKELSEKIKENFNQNASQIFDLEKNLKAYNHNLKKQGLRDVQVANPSSLSAIFIRFFLAVLLLPVHMYGMVLNYLPYRLPVFLARNIKDRHFISSVRFVLGLVFFFFWYLILFAISFFIFKQVLLWLLCIVSLPFTGIFSFYYYRNVLKMQADLRWIRLKRKDKKVHEEIILQRQDIISQVDKIINK